jgi:hypothetical protein
VGDLAGGERDEIPLVKLPDFAFRWRDGIVFIE